MDTGRSIDSPIAARIGGAPRLRDRTAWLIRALLFYLASDWLIGPYVVLPIVHRLGRRFDLVNDHLHHVLSSGRAILFDATVLTATLATVAILVATDRRDRGRSLPRALGRQTNMTGGHRWLPCLATGALAGASLATAIIGVLLAVGLMLIVALPAPAAWAVTQQLLLAAASLAAGLTEEFAFRGYAQYALTKSLSFWPATILTSLWFGWAHYGEGDPIIGAASVAEWGVFSCLALRATGNLAFSVGFHAAWNYAENGVFGVSDSSFLFRGALAHTTPHGSAVLTGGSVGPEGSVLFLGTNALMIVGLILWNARSTVRPALASPTRPARTPDPMRAISGGLPDA